MLNMPISIDIIKSFRELSLHQASPLSPNVAKAFESLSIGNNTIILTPAQERTITAETPEIVPFPKHLFPQLKSLTRGRNKKQSLGMEGLPHNFEYSYNPSRPFESLLRCGNFQPPSLHPNHQLPATQQPTRYYLEQIDFYTDNHGPDPFWTEPEMPRPGPLKAVVLFLLSLFFRIISPAAIAGKSILSPLSTVLRRGVLWALIKPVKLLYGLVVSVEWEVFVLMALATQLVKLLPGIGSAVLEVGERREQEPVWTIFVGGDQAIGNGHVYMGHS